MKDFDTEKHKLTEELNIEINKSQSDHYLKKVKSCIDILSNHSDLNGLLARMVIDGLDMHSTIGEKILFFENYFRDKTNLIQSDKLRQLAKKLKKKGIKITFYGQTWTNQTGDWIYFDTVLNIEELIQKFNLGEKIIVHENLDPKSGTERGFIDTLTGEGLMGKVE